MSLGDMYIEKKNIRRVDIDGYLVVIRCDSYRASSIFIHGPITCVSAQRYVLTIKYIVQYINTYIHTTNVKKKKS